MYWKYGDNEYGDISIKVPKFCQFCHERVGAKGLPWPRTDVHAEDVPRLSDAAAKVPPNAVKVLCWELLWVGDVTRWLAYLS